MKTDLFHSCGHCWVVQICWHIECSTFTASSFRIWNSSTGVPSPPLALFVVMLPKAHLTSQTRMSGSRWVITPSWLSGSWRFFLYSSSVYSCHLFIISSPSLARLKSYPRLSIVCLLLVLPLLGNSNAPSPPSKLPNICTFKSKDYIFYPLFKTEQVLIYNGWFLNVCWVEWICTHSQKFFMGYCMYNWIAWYLKNVNA